MLVRSDHGGAARGPVVLVVPLLFQEGRDNPLHAWLVYLGELGIVDRRNYRGCRPLVSMESIRAPIASISLIVSSMPRTGFTVTEDSQMRMFG